MIKVRKDNRKRRGLALLAAGIILFGLAGTSWHDLLAPAEQKPLIEADAAILLDAETGHILYEKNADQALPPASMSKMMTELLVLDQVNEGRLKWSDTVMTSPYAAEAPGAQIGFGPGESWTVRELFEATTIHSANDAAVALAEHIAGSEREFAKLMNKRAKEIGLSEEARFGNSTGLNKSDLAAFAGAAADADTIMTADDTAKLARYLIRKYPEVLDVSARGSVKLTTLDTKLQSTNMMLPSKPFAFPGNDGLKTGYTERAGYCFTGTAKQGNKRLIAVVMGTSTADARFVETEKLFHYGFQNNGLDKWKAEIAAKIGLLFA
ncbi:D-alanyl-D-alanine carboxypeptidase family protein [Paenibacillus sp. NEAU-GSW1]|uniref:D-alanyl-D-alanine carboxypeptidase family protein n=1 Tax=Paenibacillus sp. NEAU-GSW1 TaxID=2682486 RepID=UPI0012E2EA33|nr:D-alanyl-D-alanine carboxypeptidase family protein [Paenibacillus sp. NEAU-GSW1]MUT67239.1 serine hydrolase [Paenibacillus sp. NEAU-GSW1]